MTRVHRCAPSRDSLAPPEESALNGSWYADFLRVCMLSYVLLGVVAAAGIRELDDSIGLDLMRLAGVWLPVTPGPLCAILWLFTDPARRPGFSSGLLLVAMVILVAGYGVSVLDVG